MPDTSPSAPTPPSEQYSATTLFSAVPVSPTAPTPLVEGSAFPRRLRLATYCVVVAYLAILLLQQFQGILKPLFVAIFLGFLMHPIHRWLTKRGIPSIPAYGVILTIVALAFFAVGSMMYANITEVSRKLPGYEHRLEGMVLDLAARTPFKELKLEHGFLRKIHIAPQELLTGFGSALGHFGDFTSAAALMLVYLLFLIAEKVSFPPRMTLAFGPVQGAHVMEVVESISQAISEYIAVKTFVSALAGVLSYAVLAVFEVDFAASWGILIFLLNYIPYLGSLVAVALPIVLSFVQFPENEIWKAIVITISLIGVQQGIGTFVEPRMAGHRLDVSPLLIVLSLAFWGAIWGPVGMILAVPLLVIVKIVLENIPETRPIATLISNQ
jgi:predicted PurR-regulated permease PerM